MDLAGRRLSQKSSQIDALDGLRGLAVLLVFLSHTSLREWYLLPGLDFRGFGKAGVYLFFILSAFLLSRNLTRHNDSIFSRKNLLSYSIRRVLRIYPLYILYVLVGLVGYYLVASEMRFTPQFTFTAALNHIVLQEGEFIAWSIPVEFKYYFVLPVVTWIFIHLHKFHPLVGALSLIGAIGLLHRFFPVETSEVNDIRTIYYLSIFLTGSYLGVVTTLSKARFEIHHLVWLGVWVATVLALAWANPPTAEWLTQTQIANNWSHNWHAYFAFSWGGFLLAILFGFPLIRRFFELKILRYLGLISFSFYLWHFTSIIVIAYFFADMSSYLQAWSAFGLTVLVSTITYYGIEVRFSHIAVKT